MKLTSIALLALTTFGIVNADGNLNRSGGGSLNRRAESYPQLNRNGHLFNPLENLEKRDYVCPYGSFECSDHNGCCPDGSMCVPNTTKCSITCGYYDTMCSDGGCCKAGTYCGGDGYCYQNTGSGDIGTTTTTTTTYQVVDPYTTSSTSLYAFPTTSIVIMSSSTLPPPAVSHPTTTASVSSSAIVGSNNNPVAALNGATIKAVSTASIILAVAVFVAQW